MNDVRDHFSGGATRRDGAATRRDASGEQASAAVTRRDGAAAVDSAPTTRDGGAVLSRTGLMRLPEALQAAGYRIVRRLPAAGAEADLFVVEGGSDPSEQRVVKLYRHGLVPKVDVLENVQRGNPAHLIRIFEFGESEGHWFEVMEYAAHGSLRGFLRTDRPLPTSSLHEVLRELASAIAELHSYGLIHRDLKPENILVREPLPLDLVLADFGISSVTDLSQRFTTAARTARYAAPEALSGLISRAVDYWSLGMIVAGACCGRHPLADLSDERAVSHWLTTRPIDLSGIKDSRWQNLCRGLLLRDPQQRWGAEQVSRWLNGDATLVAPVAEPVANDASASRASGGRRAATPYTIGGTECWSTDELGIALARHWDIALKDLGRGLLRRWCERELNNVALDRLFQDLEESAADPNDKLLELVLFLCPEIPPTYRGVSLASEADLGALLETARSTSEREPAQRARVIVRKLARERLLRKFRLPEQSMVVVAERLDGLATWLRRHGRPVMWFPVPPLRTEPDPAAEFTSEALDGLGLALAMDPASAQQLQQDARAFADAAAFPFWFHRWLREQVSADDLFEAIRLRAVLLAARRWYERMAAELWVPPYSNAPLADPWRRLVAANPEQAVRLAALIRAADLPRLSKALSRLAASRSICFAEDKWLDEAMTQLADMIASVASEKAGPGSEDWKVFLERCPQLCTSCTMLASWIEADAAAAAQLDADLDARIRGCLEIEDVSTAAQRLEEVPLDAFYQVDAAIGQIETPLSDLFRLRGLDWIASQWRARATEEVRADGIRAFAGDPSNLADWQTIASNVRLTVNRLEYLVGTLHDPARGGGLKAERIDLLLKQTFPLRRLLVDLDYALILHQSNREALPHTSELIRGLAGGRNGERGSRDAGLVQRARDIESFVRFLNTTRQSQRGVVPSLRTPSSGFEPVSKREAATMLSILLPFVVVGLGMFGLAVLLFFGLLRIT